MPRIALLQPNADERYGHRQGYASTMRPPETGLAVLSSYIRTFANNAEVLCIDPEKTDEEIANQVANFDIVGLTDWFSNHQRVIAIAKAVKAKNKNTKIVIGGPNTAGVGKLALKNIRLWITQYCETENMLCLGW